MTDTIPWSPEAERALLGAMLTRPGALEDGLVHCTEEDLYRPQHRTLFAALKALYDRGESPDSVTLSEYLAAKGQLDEIGGPAELLSLQANTPTTDAERYARIVVNKAGLRGLISVAAEIRRLGMESDDAIAAISQAQALVGTVELPVHEGTPSPTITEFLAQQEYQDWLVPGLLERSDRVIITAREGAGKSTMLRMLATQLAAGIHPFTLSPTPRCRVLVVDVENSESQVRAKFRPLVALAGDRLPPENLRVEVKPGGLDLTQRNDVRWLTERVAANRPDIVTIGPIYKLHPPAGSNGRDTDEAQAWKVAKVFDTLRARYGIALLIEAHAPHDNGGSTAILRPFGSSLWLRWPEFGYGVQIDKDNPNLAWFVPWRGPRDTRDWPRKLTRMGKWPWSAST